MRRRDFLITTGTALTVPLFAPNLLTFGQSLAQGYRRLFTLEGIPSAPTSGEENRIQGLNAWGDLLYVLHRSRRLDGFGITGATPEGKIKWSWPLSSGTFWGPVVRPSGSILLYHRDFRDPKSTPEVMEFQDNGTLIRTIPVRGIPFGFSLAGDNLIGIHHDGSAEVVDLTGTNVTPMRFPNVHPSFEYFLVKPLTTTRIAIIDQNKARMVSFDVSGEASSPSSIDCPEITESLTFYAEEQKALVATLARQGMNKGRSAVGDVVVAACSDGSGGVYCLLSPIRLQKAVVLEVTESGKVQRTMRLTLPHRSLGKFKAPTELCMLGDELLMVYLDGDVVAFPVS